MSASIGRSTTIRPGESRTLLAVVDTGIFPVQALAAHPFGLEFCYCSINGSCWDLQYRQDDKRGADPRPVSACTSSSEIGTSVATPPPSRPKR